MWEFEPAEFQYIIVIRGAFNPAIFQPSWFAMEGLLGKQEAETARVDVIHNDITIFSADWVKLEITQDRFEISTRHQQHIEALRDLAVGTFTILSHTPLKMIGFNLMAHFRVPSVDAWHEAGHRLTPKSIWEGILSDPGMTSLTMTEKKKEEGIKGYVNITVEPSVIVQPGLFFTVNDHYESGSREITGSEEIIKISNTYGEISVKRSEDIIDNLFKRLTK